MHGGVAECVSEDSGESAAAGCGHLRRRNTRECVRAESLADEENLPSPKGAEESPDTVRQRLPIATSALASALLA